MSQMPEPGDRLRFERAWGRIDEGEEVVIDRVRDCDRPSDATHYRYEIFFTDPDASSFRWPCLSWPTTLIKASPAKVPFKVGLKFDLASRCGSYSWPDCEVRFDGRVYTIWDRRISHSFSSSSLKQCYDEFKKACDEFDYIISNIRED